jgi:chromosomal replication initiation ATPase DnaA
VSEVTGVEEAEMRNRQRGERVKASRELVYYVARRHGVVRMTELARFLQVKESSTPSHAIRRAEERLKGDPVFCRLLDRVVQKLA